MKLTLLASLLLGVVQAAPGLEVRQRPARCNADNCYRAVFGTRIAGQNARASADCSSFLGVVGSPGGSGPTTTTLTSTILTTVGTVSLTSDIVATEISTLTISTTGTVTTTDVALTTQTPVSTVSSDITLTTTTTLTVTLNAAKRDLDARVVTTSPTTTAVGGVPAYASYCSGTARFSSACACGLALGSNTLILPSTTVTTVLTTTISTQITTTIIASSTITNVETSTEIVGSTLTLSDTSTITAAPSLVTVPGSTITSTLTVTSFTTAPVVIGNGLNLCDGNFAFNGPGSGGCSSNCDCDLINVGANAGLAYCLITPIIQGDACTTNADCPSGYFCDTESLACFDASSCTSTFVAPVK